MTLLITLTVADIDTGPFNLYSNIDDYVNPFAELIEKSDLLAGYTSTVVPDGTTNIKVQSINELCSNFILLTVNTTTSTTTSTSSTTSTTSTTTTSVPLVVGQDYQGGVIFYVDGSGQHGLILKRAHLPSANWGDAISNCNNLTFDGYSDWRLPNVSELVKIYNVKNSLGVTFYTIYWGSNDYGAYGGTIDMRYGYTGSTSYKWNVSYVVAIRTF